MDQPFCNLANEIYKDKTFVLFALEIVINDRFNGDILLNPGNMRLPKPTGKNIRYKYYGYIIAPDRDDAENIFDKKIIVEKQYKTA